MPRFLSASSPTVQLDVYLLPVSHFWFEVVHLFAIVLEAHVMTLSQ